MKISVHTIEKLRILSYCACINLVEFFSFDLTFSFKCLQKQIFFHYIYKVKELLWNSDSTVLALWCEDMVKEDSEVNPKSYSRWYIYVPISCLTVYLYTNTFISRCGIWNQIEQWWSDVKFEMLQVNNLSNTTIYTCTGTRVVQSKWTCTILYIQFIKYKINSLTFS